MSDQYTYDIDRQSDRDDAAESAEQRGTTLEALESYREARRYDARLDESRQWKMDNE